jgi:hypothetical protein
MANHAGCSQGAARGFAGKQLTPTKLRKGTTIKTKTTLVAASGSRGRSMRLVPKCAVPGEIVVNVRRIGGVIGAGYTESLAMRMFQE